jgi:hypothetical protein
MRWVGYVTCMGAMRSGYRIIVGKLKGRNKLGDIITDGRIILKWILN